MEINIWKIVYAFWANKSGSVCHTQEPRTNSSATFLRAAVWWWGGRWANHVNRPDHFPWRLEIGFSNSSVDLPPSTLKLCCGHLPSTKQANWHTRMVVGEEEMRDGGIPLSGPRDFRIPMQSSQRLCCFSVYETTASQCEGSSFQPPPTPP